MRSWGFERIKKHILTGFPSVLHFNTRNLSCRFYLAFLEGKALDLILKGVKICVKNTIIGNDFAKDILNISEKALKS